jgi:phospholipid/cholesterol/gamma-HCH transport system substrate-binding protein
MPDQVKNMLIGIFVFAAVAIVIFVMMFLHPSVGDQARLLRVRFANIDKISIGTRVTFAGKPVGEVTDIQELPDIDTERKVVNGFVYVYELTLSVDSTVNVFNTDEISSRTSGLLGEKSVAINPLPPKPGEVLRIVNDEVLYANETGSVEDTLKDLRELGDKVEGLVANIDKAFTTLHKNKFWRNLGKVAAYGGDIVASIDTRQLSDSLSNFHQTSLNTREATDKINRGQGTLGRLIDSNDLYTRFTGLTDHADLILSDARSVTTRMRKGKGAFLKFFEDDDLYLRLIALTNKAETIFNDVNHYGFLFHLDKGWQRMRARRMNLLQKLRTPQEFRNYFNDEVDLITTSISRVSLVLDKMESQPACYCGELLHNTEFVKVYAELIRRVTALEESIKMYNTQVVDTAVTETELDPCCQ